MFCKNCGSNVQEDWEVCPNCGKRLKEPERPMTENKSENRMEKGQDTNFSNDMKFRISVRIVLRIVAIIALICFFCPLYMVSCAGEELAQVSGTDLTFGFQCMGEEIEGSLTYGLWGLLLLMGVVETFSNKKKLEISRKYEDARMCFYGSSVFAGATAIWIYFFTVSLQKRAEGTWLEISPCVPLYIMGIACVISVFVGGYQAYLMELRGKKNSEKVEEKVFSAIKCAGSVLGGSILIFIIVLAVDIRWGTGVPLESGTEGTNENQSIDYYLDDEDKAGDANQSEGMGEADSSDDGSKSRQDILLEDEYIFPNSDKKYLTEEEIRSVTVEEMFIGRNEIYARHGYIFQSEELNEYFNNTSWYEERVQPNWFNADSLFNDFEKRNVELIKKIEDEVNGVDDSEAFIGMEGVYICTNTIDDMTGKVEVLKIGGDTITFSLGTLEGAVIFTEEAQIINSNTVQLDLYGFIITLTWSDAEHMFVTNEGELSGMDSWTITTLTDERPYIRMYEFNQ